MSITLDTRPLPDQKTRTRKLITGSGRNAGILKFKPLQHLFPIVKPNLVITGPARLNARGKIHQLPAANIRHTLIVRTPTENKTLETK